MEKNHPLRPFRFGVVSAFARSADEWLARARRIESLGYATLLIPDNLQHTLAPLAALATAAAATRTLRVGSYVLVNDFRHPLLLAKDAASLDVLSGGRLEIGLGAGRPGFEAEMAMLGKQVDSGAVRVARLGESLRILKSLLTGEPVTATGGHYTMAEGRISPLPLQQPRPPILVAGSGPHLLRLAAREADIIALGLPPDASEDTAAERIGWIREAAGERFADIELNLNLMAVADQVPRWISGQLGLDAAALAERGSVAAVLGSTEQMCEQLLRRRERLGISYLVVSDEFIDLFAPVVERLAGR